MERATASTPLAWTIYESPIGPLTLIAGPNGVRNVHFPGHAPGLPGSSRAPMPAVTDQLDAYFAGERQSFEVDLDLRGTPLQLRIWEQLLEIPYGSTTSYGELAGRIDGDLYPDDAEPYLRPRLVGSAVGSTPTPILVPCHRVVGADGSLTGYGGGLGRKRALLDLEDGAARLTLWPSTSSNGVSGSRSGSSGHSPSMATP